MFTDKIECLFIYKMNHLKENHEKNLVEKNR